MHTREKDSYALALERNELLWEILNDLGARCWRDFERAKTPEELVEIHARYLGVKSLVQQVKDAISSARATRAANEDPGHAA